MENEIDKFGRPYPKNDVPVPRTAADCIITRMNKNTSKFEILFRFLDIVKTI